MGVVIFRSLFASAVVVRDFFVVGEPRKRYRDTARSAVQNRPEVARIPPRGGQVYGKSPSALRFMVVFRVATAADPRAPGNPKSECTVGDKNQAPPDPHLNVARAPQTRGSKNAYPALQFSGHVK